MIVAGRLTAQPWIAAPETRAVMAALTAAGAGARFVGGCVRDAVLGREVRDIDIAVAAPPEEVMRLLAAAGIRAVPTGIAHGNVTAVVSGIPFQVTTLRVDVESHGRRATVAFTDDWVADASRRDFTVNAMFADADGALYDPFGGLADLGAGIIRFVGDAERRIREDVLRLLRFFRFFAWYGTPPADAAALAACSALAPLLPTLSAERVSAELLRLLAAPDPAPVLALMADRGVLAHVLPEATAMRRLAALVAVEGLVGEADPLRRLAAVAETDAAGALDLARRLRLSTRQRERLRGIVASAPPPGPGAPEAGRRAALYRLGRERYRDLVLCAWAADMAAGDPAGSAAAAPDAAAAAAWRDAWSLPERWTIPAFPLSGRDVRAAGVPAGPAVGRVLRAVEAWWRDGDFAAGREACLAELRRCAAG